MKVVVAGAHGQVARLLIRRLREEGDGIRGLIRNPDHAGDVRDDGAEPAVCDLETAAPAEVAAHLEDADAVVFAAGAGAGSGAERKLTVDRDGAVKLLEAARAAGVGRYVMVSSVGAESPPDDDDVFSVYLRAKAEADAALTASDRSWTILRPGRLTDDAGTGRVRLTTDPVRGAIPREDVAAVLAAILHEPRAAGLTLYLLEGGDDVAGALAAHTGRAGPA
jgi:uncharacterized protein YbjT (DUF2867 family)